LTIFGTALGVVGLGAIGGLVASVVLGRKPLREGKTSKNILVEDGKAYKYVGKTPSLLKDYMKSLDNKVEINDKVYKDDKGKYKAFVTFENIDDDLRKKFNDFLDSKGDLTEEERIKLLKAMRPNDKNPTEALKSYFEDSFIPAKHKYTSLQVDGKELFDSKEKREACTYQGHMAYELYVKELLGDKEGDLYFKDIEGRKKATINGARSKDNLEILETLEVKQSKTGEPKTTSKEAEKEKAL
jgi:hypothetical protein